jgi:DNA polymerase-3 subunit beta
MKFTVSSSTLLKSLSTINGVVASNPIVPILENFLFQLEGSTLSITASDMQTVMQTSIVVESVKDGSITVPAKMVLDTLRSLHEQPITLSVNSETLVIEIATANGLFKLSGENPLDFPIIPSVTHNFSLYIDSDVLGLAISNTLFATSTDDLRPAMTGVYAQVSPESTTFVATDGHRLTRYRRTDVTTENSATLILPRKALNLIKSTLQSKRVPVKVDFNSSNVSFTFDTIKMVSRLVEERFPDYENVIPKENPNKMLIERQSFLSTLKRIAIYSNKTTNQIRLKISANELEISAEDLDYSKEAKESISCEFTGEPMEIGFNAKFLIEMLSNLDAQTVSMEMSLPNRACLIVPVEEEDNEDILMLLMPVMLNSY